VPSGKTPAVPENGCSVTYDRPNVGYAPFCVSNGVTTSLSSDRTLFAGIAVCSSRVAVVSSRSVQRKSGYFHTRNAEDADPCPIL